MYGEIVDEIHAADPNHPVAIANGDLQYIDLIANIPNLDILGSNVYRGELLEISSKKSTINLNLALFTELAQMHNVKLGREDHLSQAYYLQQQWKEIYLQSHGKGLVGNAIGGYTFQWSDGWWKYRQEENSDIMTPMPPGPMAAIPLIMSRDIQYERRVVWDLLKASQTTWTFGTLPKGRILFAWKMLTHLTLTPKASLKLKSCIHFDALSPYNYDRIYKSHLAVAKAEENAKGNIADLYIEMTTIASGNSLQGNLPDHGSHFATSLPQPTDAMRAEAPQYIGACPRESHRPSDDEARVNGIKPWTLMVKKSPSLIPTVSQCTVQTLFMSTPCSISQATLERGTFTGRVRVIFQLYREAYYGPNPDIYNANVPIGIEVEGKGKLSSLKMAAGPQIYWGANPTAILKYYKPVGRWNIGALHQEDFAAQDTITTLNAVPEQLLRRSSVYATQASGPFTFEVGGLLSGLNKVGRFEYTQDSQSSGYATVEKTF